MRRRVVIVPSNIRLLLVGLLCFLLGVAITLQPAPRVSSRLAGLVQESALPAACFSNGCPIAPANTAARPERLPASVLELLQTYEPTSLAPIADILAAQQSPHPGGCKDAKYLLVDDISTVSGLGYSIITMVAFALQAVVTDRILVHASSVVPGVRWAWCAEDPHSVDCYYRPWTSCLGYLRSLNLSNSVMTTAPQWKDWAAPAAVPLAEAANAHRLVVWSQLNQSRDDAFYWIEGHFAQHTRASRFWWYSVFMRHFFSPSPAMDAEARTFLQRHGLAPHDTFIVAHVRHGSKAIEQALIPPDEFVGPIKKMLHCLNTTHVYLVTETKAVVDRMMELAREHGFHVFTVKYEWPDRDTWNMQLNQRQNASNMQVIGRVSAKVLAITRRGSGFIGTVHSAWAKVSVAHMYGFHQRPIPTLSLRPGWSTDRSYWGVDRRHWTFDAASQPWPCVQEPIEMS